MSEENVEIVRRCVEFWAQRDYSRMKNELLSPDVVIDLSRNVFNPDIYRGYDDIRRWVEEVDEMWDEFQADVDEVVDEGDCVVTGIRIGHGSGIKTEMKLFEVWKLRDGKMVRATGGTGSSTRPSKPPGCGSWRCRRRTSRSSRKPSRHGTGATSMP